MPRLLLVARNPGLAFGLASASDDILEVRPSLVARLAVSPGMADVVVIEQEKPADALATLDLIRAAGLMAPALLVASSRVEWSSFEAGDRPSVAVLDPPVTQERLGSSVGSTSSLPAADDRPVEPDAPSEAPAPEEPTDGSEGPAAVSAASSDDELPTAPVFLEPLDEPYATATRTKPAKARTARVAAVAAAEPPSGSADEVGSDVDVADTSGVDEAQAPDAVVQDVEPPTDAAVVDTPVVDEGPTAEPVQDEKTLAEESRPEEPPTETTDPDVVDGTADGADEPEPVLDEKALDEAAEVGDETEPVLDEKALDEAAEVGDETEPVLDEKALDESSAPDESAPEEAATETAEIDQELLPGPVLDEKALAESADLEEGAPGDTDLDDTDPEETSAEASEVDQELLPEQTVVDDEPLPDLGHDEEAVHETNGVDEEHPAEPFVFVVPQRQPVAETQAPEPVFLSPEPKDESAASNGFASVAVAASVLSPSGSWFDSFPRAGLDDDEAELAPAPDSPSPAAWTTRVTEPVLAWSSASVEPVEPVGPTELIDGSLAGAGSMAADQEPLRVFDSVTVPVAAEPVARYPSTTDASVYASMASLMAASEELLADEQHEPNGAGPVTDDPTDDVDIDEEVDIAALFSVGAGITPNPRLPMIVDVREPSQEMDPRSAPVLVRALLARSHEVYGVAEAGSYVISDALARTGATAGALLLPDGDAWRVAAGEGLRRLEHRYVLAEDAWLVTTIASRQKGIIVDRTDVARRPLAGAPLAAHKHLVAAPVRAVSGIMLIARDDDPAFTEADLVTLADLADSSAAVLAAALDARQLARALADMTDQDNRAAADRIDYGI